MSNDTKSFWLGAIGITIFAFTLPMTKLATGSVANPELSPWFVSFGRAAFAGMLSVIYLYFTHAPRPQKGDASLLALAALGNGLGWPIFLALGLQYVESTHAAVMTGILPLATAALAAAVFGRKPSLRFWFFAVLGTLLVIAFSLLRGGNGLHIQWADGLLILAVLSAALGYVFGAKLSQRWKGEHVICWVSVFLLPITVPLTLYTWPTHAVSTAAWGGFVYVTLLSAWLGMFVWYRALAMGDAVKVSQLQLAQPFLSIVFSIPLLGEQPDQTVWIFGIAVILTVFLSRK